MLPAVPDVVRDPGMVIGKITEGDHGDPVCVDVLRVQRVAVQSAEAANREAAEVAQGGAIGQAVGEMAETATGDKAKPTAGHVDRLVSPWKTAGTVRPVVISPRQTVGAGRPVMALHRKTAGSVRPDTEWPRVTAEGAAHPDPELHRTKEGRMNFEGLLGVA
ncbi:hypothetical protein DPMN_081482 [Dreissena polymorpha]|uniref:Uncharacterized protein n=1 Tax=Dreissena polymorpha TaxID=45954 RepID=A0A9D4BHT8_DREPO|nr:hypothetical protein DPMN_081482 [Dreissena polymorpha]